MNDTAYATDKVLYVSTSSYASDSSDYVSSVVDDTPFPSLTKNKYLVCAGSNTDIIESRPGLHMAVFGSPAIR